MDSMAVIIRFIWRSVVLDKLLGLCCKGAKMFIVGFL
jgi:hypothetical protein